MNSPARYRLSIYFRNPPQSQPVRIYHLMAPCSKPVVVVKLPFRRPPLPLAPRVLRP